MIVADEFQNYLCSKERHEGLDLFLGGCREFGAIALLATQSVSQLQSVFGHWSKVEALLGHVRGAFIGQSTCALTTQWAETVCGMKSGTTRPLMIGWHRDPQVAGLRENHGADEPVVARRDASALRTGMFYVRNPGGQVFLADARRDLAAPKITQLHP